MDAIDVERVGGFAGFGGPGSRLRSRGRVDPATLSSADRTALAALFDHPPAAGPHPDGFSYRLTRHGAQVPQTVEVAEQHVPESIRAVVKDELG
jgi:hypothetical protein